MCQVLCIILEFHLSTQYLYTYLSLMSQTQLCQIFQKKWQIICRYFSPAQSKLHKTHMTATVYE